MTTTILSSKGQVIIPKAVRDSHHWAAGQKLEVVDTGEGVLLRPVADFPTFTLKEVVSAVKYGGRRKSLEDMEDAIRKGARR